MNLFLISLILASAYVNGYSVKRSVLKMASGDKLSVKPGSIVALVTPMKANTNQIDYPKLNSLLEWHVSQVLFKENNLCIEKR